MEPYDFSEKKVIPFATSGSGQLGKSSEIVKKFRDTKLKSRCKKSKESDPMNDHYEIQAKPENIEKAIRHIDEVLSNCKISSQKKVKTILIAEETIAKLIEHTDEDSTLVMDVHGVFGNVNLKLKCRGSSFDIDDIESHLLFEGNPGEDDTENEIIHRFVDKVFWDRLSIRNDKNVKHRCKDILTSP